VVVVRDRATPSEYLKETMAARAIMLNNYGPNILRPGEPVGALRDARLWMTYLHHRWAIESGLRYVGGMFHTYNVKGDSGAPTEIVPAATQREVLGLLLSAIARRSNSRRCCFSSPAPGSNLEDLSSDCAFDHLRAAHTRRDGARRPAQRRPGGASRLRGPSANALALPEVVTEVLKGHLGATRNRVGARCRSAA
jgi:hypothetical protein